jgi:flagellar basal-body rod protein FlgB
MGIEVATRLSEEIARYLDLNTRQIEITTANMANIDTPCYRAVGMDFEAEMRRAMAGVDAEDGSDAAGGVLAEAGAPHLAPVAGLIVRPDGNNVSMDRESLQLAEAQLKFKTGVALLKREYTRVMDAIHADGH